MKKYQGLREYIKWTKKQKRPVITPSWFGCGACLCRLTAELPPAWPKFWDVVALADEAVERLFYGPDFRAVQIDEARTDQDAVAFIGVKERMAREPHVFIELNYPGGQWYTNKDGIQYQWRVGGATMALLAGYRG